MSAPAVLSLAGRAVIFSWPLPRCASALRPLWERSLPGSARGFRSHRSEGRRKVGRPAGSSASRGGDEATGVGFHCIGEDPLLWEAEIRLDKCNHADSVIRMTEAEQLQRDIDALRESIQRGWEEIAASGTGEERQRLRDHLRVCIDDLSGLLARLETTPGAEMRKA